MDEMSRVYSDNQSRKSHWIYVFSPFLVCFIPPVPAAPVPTAMKYIKRNYLETKL